MSDKYISGMIAKKHVVIMGTACTGKINGPPYDTQEWIFNPGEFILTGSKWIRIYTASNPSVVYFEIEQDSMKYSCIVYKDWVELMEGK